MVEQIVKTCTFHRKFAAGFTRPTLKISSTTTKTYLAVRRKDMMTLSALKGTNYDKDINRQDNQTFKDDGKKMKTVHTVAVSVVPTNRATDAVSLDDDKSLETWNILQKIRAELKDPGFYR